MSQSAKKGKNKHPQNDYSHCTIPKQAVVPCRLKADRAHDDNGPLKKVHLWRVLAVDSSGIDMLKCSREHMWFPVKIPYKYFLDHGISSLYIALKMVFCYLLRKKAGGKFLFLIEFYNPLRHHTRN